MEVWIYKILKRRRLKVEYETEKIPYTLTKNYIPDFIIFLKNGKKIYVEAKGYFSPVDRAKIKSVKESNPELDLRIVFARDNILRKGAKSTYTQWADKLKIPWAINSPPKAWFK